MFVSWFHVTLPGSQNFELLCQEAAENELCVFLERLYGHVESEDTQHTHRWTSLIDLHETVEKIRTKNSHQLRLLRTEIDPRELTALGEPTTESVMRLVIQTGITLADWKYYYDCINDNSSILDICQKSLLYCGREGLVSTILMS
jgi:hypothetical protein